MDFKFSGDEVLVDLHCFSCQQVFGKYLSALCQEAWEMGKKKITFIHGHGRSRGIRPQRSGTNTGRLGWEIRRTLLTRSSLRPFILVSTLERHNRAFTSIRIKRNYLPSRQNFSEKICNAGPAFKDN